MSKRTIFGIAATLIVVLGWWGSSPARLAVGATAFAMLGAAIGMFVF